MGDAVITGHRTPSLALIIFLGLFSNGWVHTSDARSVGFLMPPDNPEIFL
jgi:hypothetical protein